jgi:hypothetical protein
MPGSDVSVVLYLSVPAEVRVGVAMSKITFPNKLLSFQKASKGPVSEGDNAEVIAVANVDDKNPDNSVVQVTVSGEGGKPIPAGIVANLTFKISQHAPVGQTIILKNAASVLTTENPPRPVKPLMAQDGQIKVTATPPTPTFSCFFYMH